jgi:hypothetical protein
LARIDPRPFRALGAAAFLDASPDPHLFQGVSQVGGGQLINSRPVFGYRTLLTLFSSPMLALVFSFLRFKNFPVGQGEKLLESLGKMCE